MFKYIIGVISCLDDCAAYIGKDGQEVKDIDKARKFASRQAVATYIRNRQACKTWGYEHVSVITK